VLSLTDMSALLQKGIAAARSGRTLEARSLLEQVVQTDPDNEMAWLWLSGLMTTNQQKCVCLEQVLRTNPENVYARAGLARLQKAMQRRDGRVDGHASFSTLPSGSDIIP
jgi:thioredoxin-like negative regulator of GroEL